MTRRANIEQSINHAWLKVPTRPESAAGGDVRSSQDYSSNCRRDGGGEQKSGDTPLVLPRSKKGYTEAEGQPVRSTGDYQVKTQPPNTTNTGGPKNFDNMQDLTNRLSSIKQRLSPR